MSAAWLLRRWFQMREQFHDWMWTSKVTLPRRLARRLPLYFSDPYYVTDDEFDALMERGIFVVTAGSPWIKVQLPSTWTSTATSTFVWRTNQDESPWIKVQLPSTWTSTATSTFVWRTNQDEEK